MASRQATTVFDAMSGSKCKRCGYCKASTRHRRYNSVSTMDSAYEYCDECATGAGYYKKKKWEDAG